VWGWWKTREREKTMAAHSSSFHAPGAMQVVAMRTSIQKKKTVAFVPGENDFDFDNLASELIASHNRDLSNHEKVLDEEKQKQKLQLEEKLRKRKEARRRQLLSAKRDLTEVEIDEEIVLEERAVRNEWKEEREMNEYLDNELNDGVIRAVTRGGQFAEKGEFDNNWVNGEEEKVDESLERIKLKDVGKQNTMERNKETSKKLIKEHDEATKALIEDLKENRRASHQKMLDRLAKRRKEVRHYLLPALLLLCLVDKEGALSSYLHYIAEIVAFCADVA